MPSHSSSSKNRREVTPVLSNYVRRKIYPRFTRIKCFNIRVFFAVERFCFYPENVSFFFVVLPEVLICLMVLDTNERGSYERQGVFSGSRVVMAHTSFRQDRKWNLHDLMTKLTSSVFAMRCLDSGTKWMLTFPLLFHPYLFPPRCETHPNRGTFGRGGTGTPEARK